MNFFLTIYLVFNPQSQIPKSLIEKFNMKKRLININISFYIKE